MTITTATDHQYWFIRTVLYAVVFVVFIMFCFGMQADADTLFAYRYVIGLMGDQDVLIMVQPGPRMFPEWVYSWVILNFVDDPIAWSRGMLLINSGAMILSLGYLFRQMFPRQLSHSLDLTFLSLACLPALNVLHVNYLEYHVFMHGTHAFVLPFVLGFLGQFIKWYRTSNLSRSSQLVFVLVVGLLLASNMLVLLLLLGPLFGLTIWLIMVGKMHWRFGLHLILLMVCSGLVGWLFSAWIKWQMNELVFLPNQLSLYGVAQWFSEHKMFNQLLDRGRSGYMLEIMVLSLLGSLLWLVKKEAKPNSMFKVFLGFYVLAWAAMMLAFAVTGKNHIRYTPHLMFIAPVVVYMMITLLVSSRQVIVGFQAVILAGLICTVFIIETDSIEKQKKFKIGLENIEQELSDIRQTHQLTGDGLTDYWLSHAYQGSEFSLLPITRGKQSKAINPVPWAMDVNSYWHQKGTAKEPRYFDLVVNYRFTDSQVWKINESVMVSNLGTYQTSVVFKKGLYEYKIYLYPGGIDMNRFYHQLKAVISATEQV